MKTQLLILFITFFTLTSSAQNYTSFKELKNEIVSKTVPLISVKDLKKVENTKKPFLILDAREKEEYNTSHIKNAKYVGYDNFKMSAIKEVDKNTTIIIYCSVGYRSEKIGEKLKKLVLLK
jgi:rhodanese-related sulfurtransferase